MNNFEAFLRYFQGKCEAIIKVTRLFEHIFKEMKALTKKIEAFLKTTRIFEDIFNEIEAFLK
jgi:hypothetical protein